MKRILALLGVIILVVLYITTLVCAIINSPLSVTMFKASITLTIIIPVLIAGFQILYRALRGNGAKRNDEEK